MTWRRYKLNLRNSLLLEEYFRVMEQFDTTLSSIIDSTLGLRCRSFGYRSGVAVIGDLIVGIEFELNSILVEKWKGKAYGIEVKGLVPPCIPISVPSEETILFNSISFLLRMKSLSIGSL